MKILHLCYSNKYSGGENVICQIVNIFKNRNSDIEMCVCVPDGQIVSILKSMFIPYIIIKKYSVNNLKKILEKVKPDVIHAHDLKMSVLASFFSNKYKIVSHIHCNHLGMNKITLKSIIYNFSSKRFNHIFWVSDSALNSYVFKKRILKKSSVLSNVVDSQLVNIRANLDLKQYYNDIIFLGRLTFQKNPERFLEIAKSILREDPNVRFCIVGAGDLEEQIHNLINDNNLSKNIVEYGYMDNPLKILMSSKILLMTSRFEGTPMVALEAMSLGKPVVATPVDGLKNIINKNNGFLSDDNLAISDFILNILKNPKEYKRLSETTFEESKKINNIENYYCSILSVYRSCINAD